MLYESGEWVRCWSDWSEWLPAVTDWQVLPSPSHSPILSTPWPGLALHLVPQLYKCHLASTPMGDLTLFKQQSLGSSVPPAHSLFVCLSFLC